MTTPSNTHSDAHIARVAYAIWEAEGRPEGCDHEHWMRARQLIEAGRAEIEFPVGGPAVQDDRAPRRVQPGFEDAVPGMVPQMKSDPGPELREEPGGRFAEQLDDAPEGRPSEQEETPGPRNPSPIPPTNADGYAVVPSVDDAAAGSVFGDPRPPETAGKAQPEHRAAPTDAESVRGNR